MVKKKRRKKRKRKRRKKRRKRKLPLLLKSEKIQQRLNLLEVHQVLQLDTTSINLQLKEVNHTLKNKAKELWKLHQMVFNINQLFFQKISMAHHNQLQYFHQRCNTEEMLEVKVLEPLMLL
jgi:DNA polymerase sigma